MSVIDFQRIAYKNGVCESNVAADRLYNYNITAGRLYN